MNTRLKKYIRFWVWVDLAGFLFAILLILGYLFWGNRFSDHIQNLWSNLAIEVLGVWLSVRIIDFLIQRHRSFRETRFHQLRNLGFFADTATHSITYSPKARDIEIMEQEILYFEKRWPKRQRHFYKDEREQILLLRNSMPPIIETCKNLALSADQHFSEIDYAKHKESLKELLYRYRTNLEQLRDNIWEESHPDD